jgi:hypothetical protein
MGFFDFLKRKKKQSKIKVVDHVADHTRKPKKRAKDYHKKKRITFRWSPRLIGEFKEECLLHGLHCSDVTELMVRDMLHRGHIKKLKKKIGIEA